MRTLLAISLLGAAGLAGCGDAKVGDCFRLASGADRWESRCFEAVVEEVGEYSYRTTVRQCGGGAEYPSSIRKRDILFPAIYDRIPCPAWAALGEGGK